MGPRMGSQMGSQMGLQMGSRTGPRKESPNLLLSALPIASRERLLPALESVKFKLGQVVYEAEQVEQYVYFPTDSIVSLLYVMESGASAEIAVVGNDGMLGVAVVMGGGSTTARAVVQAAGHAWRLPARLLKEELARQSELLALVLRYTQALLTQMAQTAVCNRLHNIDQQLARWLLLSLDRLPTDTLTMTQELISNMLGVRREGVTQAAGKLSALGVIEYRRGRIKVLDRAHLERLSCECYAVVKVESDRLLSDFKPPTVPGGGLG